MDDYSDIIDLPHPDPKQHPRMPIEQRAQQLMPFASLPKYYDKLEEIQPHPQPSPRRRGE